MRSSNCLIGRELYRITVAEWRNKDKLCGRKTACTEARDRLNVDAVRRDDERALVRSVGRDE